MDYLGKVSYLKGLCDGLGIDQSTKEGKVLNAVIDVLDDLTIAVADLEDGLAEISEQVDLIDEDLDNMEKDFYDEDEDEDECCDEALYEVTCPKCGEVLYLDECEVEDGSVLCPSCNEKLEFDFDEESCGCGDCGCEK